MANLFDSNNVMSKDRAMSSLTLYRTPEIDRIEPKFIFADSIQNVVVSGRNFDGLIHTGDTFMCRLIDERGQDMGIVAHGLLIDSQKLTCGFDQILRNKLSLVKAQISINISF